MVKLKPLVLWLAKTCSKEHKRELIITHTKTSALFFIQTMLSRFFYCSPPYKESLRATGLFVCKENFSLNRIVYNVL